MSDAFVSYIGSFIRYGSMLPGPWYPVAGLPSWNPYSDDKGVMQFKKVGTSDVKPMDRQRQLEFWNLVIKTDEEYPPAEDETTTFQAKTSSEPETSSTSTNLISSSCPNIFFEIEVAFSFTLVVFCNKIHFKSAGVFLSRISLRD